MVNDRGAMCIHLLSTIDVAYVVPFRVTAHSLVSKKDTNTPLCWHLCERGLSTRNRAEIESSMTSANVRVAWHDLAASKTAGLPVRGRAVAKMYERLLVPGLLADEVERFIYLDGDLLVLDRIENLWGVDLGGSIIGAVQDLAIPLVSSPLGLSRFEDLGFERDEPYFNAGVYIVDVEAWQKNRISARAVEYLDKYRQYVNLLDQDALNAVLSNRWKPLDYRWNLTAGLAARDHFEPRGVDLEQLDRAVADPGILHFSGYLKPWIFPQLGSRWARLYESTLREVLPEHRFDESIKAHLVSHYDRRLRTRLYPLERALWRRMKGF